MNKRDLDQKVMEVDARLKALGDLNALVQQSQALPSLVGDAQTKKVALETLLNEVSTHKNELVKSIDEAKTLTDQVTVKEGIVAELVKRTEDSQKKVIELIEETKIQLGIAANAKLASTFEQVKTDLAGEKTKMFKWLVGIVGFLVVATLGVVWWQIKETGTLYHLSFPVRIALLSPIVYFVVFINREYNRARNLIEEYTFKASIARSFEAYREIVESADSENSTKTLDFILKSISDLYSSPMVNIKNNNGKEKEDFPDIISQARSVVGGITSENKS